MDALGGYAYTRGDFLDVATCVYDWFGRCVRERRQPGETDSRPHDEVYWDHSSFGRLNLAWRLHPQHALRLAVAPTYLTRTGDERRQADPTARDPLTAERNLLTVVNGLEYELDLFGDRLENIAFVKEYVQILESEEPRAGGIFRRRDRATHRFGVWRRAALPLHALALRQGLLRVGDAPAASGRGVRRQAAALRFIGDGKALISVFHDERVEITPEADRPAIADSANWRSWTLDLDTLDASELDGLDWHAGGFYASRIDGRNHVFIPSADYSSTEAFELSSTGSVEPRWTATGWVTRLFKVR